jgi:hypothetical protein
MKVLLSHIADSERKMIGAIEPLRDCRNMVTGGSPQSSLANGYVFGFTHSAKTKQQCHQALIHEKQSWFTVYGFTVVIAKELEGRILIINYLTLTQS